jgi:hypothetical protein
VQVNDTVKQVNLSVKLSNEGASALAKNFTFRVQNATEYLTVNSPLLVDLGDGSYNISFIVENTAPQEPLAVSVLCLDQRGITIKANFACNQI